MEGFEDSDDEDDEVLDNSQLDSEPDSPRSTVALDTLATSLAGNAIEDDYDHIQEDQRNVRAKLSHPSSPRSTQTVTLPRLPEVPSTSTSKITIVIKDVAYNTYLALLYYVSILYLSYRLGFLLPPSLIRYTLTQSFSHHYRLLSFQHKAALKN
jgi:hypothetical protein